MGLCAGGYFGAKEVQFEMGTPLQVHGTRDLSFFPGIAKGTVFPGFDYASMRGCKGRQKRARIRGRGGQR